MYANGCLAYLTIKGEVMTENTLLIITTGQTDVQFVIDGTRKEFAKNNCAELHTAIKNLDKSRWSFQDTAVYIPKAGQKDNVTQLPNGDWQLCTPKLDAILRCCEDSKITLNAVVILTTERTRNARDPHCAGDILKRRLEEKGVDGKNIHTCPYLDDEIGTLEDANEDRDAVIRHEIVEKLDDIIRTTIEVCGTSTRVLVATTGGIAKINDLINNIVRLYSTHDPEIIKLGDGSENQLRRPDKAVIQTLGQDPSASFRVRRQALDLIQSGDFLGAWGAVRHLDDSEKYPDERNWIKVVKWLYQFAASLPNDDCDIPILLSPYNSVQSALRVELAVRTEDVPRAVQGAVAFSEVAIWDYLKRKLSLQEADIINDVIKIQEPVDEKFVGKNKNDGKPFIKQEDSAEYYRYMIRIDARTARDFGAYIGNNPLKDMIGKVGKIRELRNNAVHVRPTPIRMATVKEKMRNLQLWSSSGNTFLDQKPVQEILTRLDRTLVPARLLDDLIADVRKRLLNL
jgi:hypothetical protein